MEELTPRQIQIFKAIVEEYTESGEPVGSEILEKKYKLGVSPATVRNEMVELARKGYIKKAHFSSGRIPSASGFRYFIQHIMKEKELSTVEEVTYKASIWDDRGEIHRLLSHATKVLATQTRMLSVIATNRGDLYYSGVCNLLQDEGMVNDTELLRKVTSMLDEMNFWEQVMRQVYAMQQPDGVMYMIGEEDFKNPLLDTMASVVSEFEVPDVKGIVAVLGPKHMYYDVITPQVRYFSGLITDVTRG